jgi:hypothetical protein
MISASGADVGLAGLATLPVLPPIIELIGHADKSSASPCHFSTLVCARVIRSPSSASSAWTCPVSMMRIHRPFTSSIASRACRTSSPSSSTQRKIDVIRAVVAARDMPGDVLGENILSRIIEKGISGASLPDLDDQLMAHLTTRRR